MDTEPVIAPVIAGIENDPVVREAMKHLALTAIDSAETVLLEGSPAVQLQMIRILLPGLSRTVGKTDGSEDDTLRRKLTEMYENITDALGGDDDG